MKESNPFASPPEVVSRSRVELPLFGMTILSERIDMTWGRLTLYATRQQHQQLAFAFVSGESWDREFAQEFSLIAGRHLGAKDVVFSFNRDDAERLTIPFQPPISFNSCPPNHSPASSAFAKPTAA